MAVKEYKAYSTREKHACDHVKKKTPVSKSPRPSEVTSKSQDVLDSYNVPSVVHQKSSSETTTKQRFYWGSSCGMLCLVHTRPQIIRTKAGV